MQGSTVHSKATQQMMELAVSARVPVLFHDGTPPTSETLQIAYLAERYPEAKVILGHSGMFDTWKSAVDACNRLDNLYLCISASPVGGRARNLRPRAPRPAAVWFGLRSCAHRRRVLEPLRRNRIRLRGRGAERANFLEECRRARSVIVKRRAYESDCQHQARHGGRHHLGRRADDGSGKNRSVRLDCGRGDSRGRGTHRRGRLVYNARVRGCA